jgi:hypothetical protein
VSLCAHISRSIDPSFFISADIVYSSDPSEAISEMRAELLALSTSLLQLGRGDIDRDGKVVATVPKGDVPPALAKPLSEMKTILASLQNVLGADEENGEIKLPSPKSLKLLDELFVRIAALPSPPGVQDRVIDGTASVIDYFYMIVTHRVVEGRATMARATDLISQLMRSQK